MRMKVIESSKRSKRKSHCSLLAGRLGMVGTTLNVLAIVLCIGIDDINNETIKWTKDSVIIACSCLPRVC